MARMLYQGHGSFRLTTESDIVVYVDPYAGEGYDVPADLILVTHEHGDHTAVDKMPHADGCEILRAKDFLPAPGSYQTLVSHGLRITAVQAYNKNHPIDECVGLVIEIDGLKFYAAGDTSTTDDMRSGKLADLNLDYATLPGDGFYNMGPEEGSECARLIAARHFIPIHLVPVHDMSNPTIFCRKTAERFIPDGRIILAPGEELDL